MANTIKYSGTNETKALNKGNWYIGVGDVDKGPTETTGFYAAGTPPVGGYTIYTIRPDGIPSMFVANNDQELIILTNQISYSGFTTVAECLNYFATQDDKMVVNKNYEGIVTDGLVLNLDATFLPSYPITGTTWHDLSGNNYDGSLINGPEYNNGSLIFDGTDDLVNVSNAPFLNSTVTAEAWIKVLGNPGGGGDAGTIIYHAGRYFQYRNDGKIASHWAGGYYYTPAGSISYNQWAQVVQVWDVPNGILKVYVNNNLLLTQSISTSTKPSSYVLQIGMENTNPSYPYSRIFNGEINTVRLYDRALSEQEIQQNYYKVPIVTDGLVLAVDAGNIISYESGSTTTYSLVGSYNGTLENGLSFSPDNGGIWNLDGTDDGINFGNILDDLVDLSLECWVKFGTQDSTHNGVISKTLDNTDGWEIRTVGSYTSTQTDVQFRYVGDNATTSSVFLDNEVWHHIVGTGESGAQKLYVNGILVKSSGSTNTPSPNTNSLYIGALSYASFRRLTGSVGISRIYNRVLSQEEVTQNYNAQKSRFGL